METVENQLFRQCCFPHFPQKRLWKTSGYICSVRAFSHSRTSFYSTNSPQPHRPAQPPAAGKRAHIAPCIHIHSIFPKTKIHSGFRLFPWVRPMSRRLQSCTKNAFLFLIKSSPRNRQALSVPKEAFCKKYGCVFAETIQAPPSKRINRYFFHAICIFLLTNPSISGIIFCNPTKVPPRQSASAWLDVYIYPNIKEIRYEQSIQFFCRPFHAAASGS